MHATRNDLCVACDRILKLSVLLCGCAVQEAEPRLQKANIELAILAVSALFESYGLLSALRVGGCGVPLGESVCGFFLPQLEGRELAIYGHVENGTLGRVHAKNQ